MGFRLLIALTFAAAVMTAADAPPSVATKHSFADDQVFVEYCISCGYANNFHEVRKYLETNYPHLIGRVTGGNAAPPAWKAVVATISGYLQMAGFVFLLAGEHIISALNLSMDNPIFAKIRENKFAAFTVLLLLSSVSSSMSATGAFEVYFNSYANNYREVSRYLEANYPHLIGRISGANALPPAWKQQLASFLGYVQMAGFALLLAGEHILGALGLPLDMPLFVQMRENKFAAFAGIMILGSISQSMLATGAFEVYFNDDLIYSKIRMNRWPTMSELLELFQAAGLRRP
ncbi:hypothetical protein ACHHYP_12581 [Achlya hypogyna]|uniref:Selenoprotein T n=1 Tax=Achlya hypogyna TaxID=1202772 RepID=A0A1V9YGR5_ACHHY|nr:hypothetical protein ACHHYP_12581 [Achlya hypogyna]